MVAGGSEAGLGAGVAGGRREPRPQQQNMYNGAGSQMHGGEYVQLTWLVSWSQDAMWCKYMGRSRTISKNGDRAPLYLPYTNNSLRTQHIFTE